MTYSLRIAQNTEGVEKYRVDVVLEKDGLPQQMFTTLLAFSLTAQEQEELRWYLEDFLEYPLDPAPIIARRVENRMVEIGIRLFNEIFLSSKDGRSLWTILRRHLSETRIEVLIEHGAAEIIPWELIRHPKANSSLAIEARAFVRSHVQAARSLASLSPERLPIRILLVICRPGGGDDVPFRSVAGRIIRNMYESQRQVFQLDVLRPPTVNSLKEALHRSAEKGNPYHVVHFDGHGIYEDLQAMYSGRAPKKRRGYLLFENPEEQDNVEPLHGELIGELLSQTYVPLLILNACRSAHADPQVAPEEITSKRTDTEVGPHVRAFGSLAREVMGTGVRGVVAMRYNVYVDTAAQFISELYEGLGYGHTVGEAVTRGRRQLASQPLREVGYRPLPLQDWIVPIVYEATPVRLFPEIPDSQEPLARKDSSPLSPATSLIDAKLPPSPEGGFFGRDEVLLAIDRGFDTRRVILLHAYAGSGKTAVAAEFARWYVQTRGIEGPVIFTSFEYYKPLSQVLDQVKESFGQTLEQMNINWPALSGTEKYELALQLLNRTPVLWIWDAVESIAGFPTDDESAWNKEEQQALAKFLRDTAKTKAKLLLTSRRDEARWLGDSPARVTVPPMPMQERMLLAKALIKPLSPPLTLGQKLISRFKTREIEPDGLRELLEFTDGNPLTLKVLVRQVLREGLLTKESLRTFVSRLRSGERVLHDDVGEGRTMSLGASLNYGFQNAFSEEELKQLALLHFFHGWVGEGVWCAMGNPQLPTHVPELQTLTPEKAALLLDRAAELGLLTAHGYGYSIHPVLPWFFKDLLHRYYGDPFEAKDAKAVNAMRTFVEVMSYMGRNYSSKYHSGEKDLYGVLVFEEPNLKHALRLARSQGWWDKAVETMLGLSVAHETTGRDAQWHQLVAEVMSELIDPLTDLPLPGTEEVWPAITQFRVHLALQSQKGDEAHRLIRIFIERSRRHAAPLLDKPIGELNESERNDIHTMVVSILELGDFQRNTDRSQCVDTYEEALKLAEHIGQQSASAALTFRMGQAYERLTGLLNPEKAEEWFRRSLELRTEQDRVGKAECLNSLSHIAFMRYQEAARDNQPEGVRISHLRVALDMAQQALALTPPGSKDLLGANHQAVGVIYMNLGDVDRALLHLREALRYLELVGDRYNSSITRINIAITLRKAGRLADAKEYARAVLRHSNTESSSEVNMARQLLAEMGELH